MRLNPNYLRDILLFIEKELDYEDVESNTPHKHTITVDIHSKDEYILW